MNQNMKKKCGESKNRFPQGVLRILMGSFVLWLLLSLPARLSCGDEIERIERLDEACRGGRKEACAELIEIARKNEKWEWRKAAVEKVSDQEVLKEIAGKNDEEIAVRIAAVRRIADRDILENLERSERDINVRLAVSTRLSEVIISTNRIPPPDMKHFEINIPPVTRTSDQEGGRIAAEVQSKHEAVIQEIRKTGGECQGGNREACDRLFEIAENNGDSRLRGAAVEQIRNEGQLIRFARKSDDIWVVLAAVQNRHLRDQKVLGEIARNSENEIVRLCAVKKITDQAVLIELYGNEANTYVRMALVDQLTDYRLLDEIAGNDGDLGIRHVALERYQLLKREAAAEKKDRLKNQQGREMQ